MNMFGASGSIICLSYHVKAYHTYCGLNRFMMFALISIIIQNKVFKNNINVGTIKARLKFRCFQLNYITEYFANLLNF